MNFQISRILRHPSSVSESAISHGVTMCGEGVVYIQSGSCSCSAGYGNSSSSSWFLSASFCIRFIASAKAVRLDAESTSHFSMPPYPAQGTMGEPRDIGVPRLDPQPEPSAHDNPTSMGKPGAGHAVVGHHTWQLVRPRCWRGLQCRNLQILLRLVDAWVVWL